MKTEYSEIDFGGGIGQVILAQRIALGWSQRHFANLVSAKLGRTVDQTYWSKVEKGKIDLSLRRFGVVCDVLKLSPTEFMAKVVQNALVGNMPEADLEAEFDRRVVETQRLCPTRKSG